MAYRRATTRAQATKYRSASRAEKSVILDAVYAVTEFNRDYAASGSFPVESVDVVLSTHLHFDHIGWHTRCESSSWVSAFPIARYLVNGLEGDLWEALYDAGDPPVFDNDIAYDDTSAPLPTSDLLEPDHAVTDEVRLAPTPGHTPGHEAVWISSRGAKAAVAGDLVHTPVELVDPRWTCSSDEDTELARRTRLAFQARRHDPDPLGLGTPYAAPTAGHLASDGHRRRLQAPSGSDAWTST